MHKSYDPLTREHYIDKYNIDFIRYFKHENLIANLIGAFIGSFVYFSGLIGIPSNFSNVIKIYFLSASVIFMLFTWIAFKAGNNFKQSMRMAGRRGLYSYFFLTFVFMIALMFFSGLTLQNTFGEFLYVLITGQIFCAVIAVPADILSTFSTKQ